MRRRPSGQGKGQNNAVPKTLLVTQQVQTSVIIFIKYCCTWSKKVRAGQPISFQHANVTY